MQVLELCLHAWHPCFCLGWFTSMLGIHVSVLLNISFTLRGLVCRYQALCMELAKNECIVTGTYLLTCIFDHLQMLWQFKGCLAEIYLSKIRIYVQAFNSNCLYERILLVKDHCKYHNFSAGHLFIES